MCKILTLLINTRGVLINVNTRQKFTVLFDSRHCLLIDVLGKNDVLKLRITVDKHRITHRQNIDRRILIISFRNLKLLNEIIIHRLRRRILLLLCQCLHAVLHRVCIRQITLQRASLHLILQLAVIIRQIIIHRKLTTMLL